MVGVGVLGQRDLESVNLLHYNYNLFRSSSPSFLMATRMLKMFEVRSLKKRNSAMLFMSVSETEPLLADKMGLWLWSTRCRLSTSSKFFYLFRITRASRPPVPRNPF